MSKVSIITTCYNGERYIARTIESVRAQTFTDWNHLIVDDGSTDSSAAIVKSYVARDPRLRLIRQSNGGLSNARNSGYAALSGEKDYLLFLDADDCLEPEMLKVMVGYLDANPNVGLAYCRCLFIDSDDSVIGKKEVIRYAPDSSGMFGVREIPPDCAETPFISVLAYAGIVPSVAVLRHSIYKLAPRWDEAFRGIAEDTDMFSRMALRSKIHYLPRQLVRKRRHGFQLTRNPQEVRHGDKKLYGKWERMKGLNPEHEALVKEALHFRRARLLPRLWVTWGAHHLRKGNLVEGVKCYLRCAKLLATSYAARVRLP